MGRLYRRRKDGPWYGDFLTPEGKRLQRTLRTQDKSVAKQRLREAELASSTSPRGRKQTLSDAIEYMIENTLHDRAEPTREMYREKGRRIITTLGDPQVSDVDRDMLQGYITLRLSSDVDHGGASRHTVAKELITIRKALREAHERGILRVMPALPRHSAKYVPKETWLTPDQFELLCAELAPERRMWASIAALAGGNSSEVEAVAWETIELPARLLIPGTKRETRRRWVPIAPALLYRLMEVDEHKRRGKVVQHWGNVRRDLHAAVERANAKLGDGPKLPKVSPNDLRRTFASWLVQQGVQLLTVATLMGHSSTRMVERVYGKLSRQNLEAAVALLPDPRRKA